MFSRRVNAPFQHLIRWPAYAEHPVEFKHQFAAPSLAPELRTG